MADGHKSRRCSSCDVNWPVHGQYTACPLCQQDTWEVSGQSPINHTEAADLIKQHKDAVEKHDRFEEHYIQRELAKFDDWWAAQLC